MEHIMTWLSSSSPGYLPKLEGRRKRHAGRTLFPSSSAWLWANGALHPGKQEVARFSRRFPASLPVEERRQVDAAPVRSIQSPKLMRSNGMLLLTRCSTPSKGKCEDPPSAKEHSLPALFLLRLRTSQPSGLRMILGMLWCGKPRKVSAAQWVFLREQ